TESGAVVMMISWLLRHVEYPEGFVDAQCFCIAERPKPCGETIGVGAFKCPAASRRPGGAGEVQWPLLGHAEFPGCPRDAALARSAFEGTAAMTRFPRL